MLWLILGLLLFLGMHSARIFADGWRDAMRARLGAGGWKGLYALVSLAGFVLIVWGYGEARMAPVDLWQPPVWTRHAAALLTWPAFILVAAAYVPRNHFRSAIGHPMLAGTKLWAIAHLLSNGRLADVVLFGAFLAWAVALFAVSRQRDRAAGVRPAVPSTMFSVLAFLIGSVVWAAFAMVLHTRLIGVAPFAIGA